MVGKSAKIMLLQTEKKIEKREVRQTIIATPTLFGRILHSFSYNYLPVSFNQMWILKRVRYPERELRNADHLYVPAHNYATLKRLPRFNFPTIWNSAGNERFNPIQHQFLKAVKSSLLQNIQ